MIESPRPRPLKHELIQFYCSWGLAAVNRTLELQPVMPGQTVETQVALATNGTVDQTLTPYISVAIKANNNSIYFFNAPVAIHVLFVEDNAVDRKQYIDVWKGIQAEKFFDIPNLVSDDVNVIQARLQAYNVTFVAKRKGSENTVRSLTNSHSFRLWLPGFCRMYFTCQPRWAMVWFSCSSWPSLTATANCAPRQLQKSWFH